MIRNELQKLFLKYNFKLCSKLHSKKTRLENLNNELNATNIK